MAASLRIKKGDTVKVVAGGLKGTTAKVERTDAEKGLVFLEGHNVVKRHVKPNQLNPRGGTREVHKGLPVSNVVLVLDDKGAVSRVGYILKDGAKVRVARQHKNKEIK